MNQSKAKLRHEIPITISGPSDDKSKSSGVHPANSYDMATEQQSDSSQADTSDIRRAQKLAINITNIDHSVPNRGIRTVIRGDFQTLQEEGEEGLRRLRTYVVAIDLSPESVFALEWSVGVTLRDGDTLICIYAIEDENAKMPADTPSSRGLSDGAQTARDTMSAMDQQTARINAGDGHELQEPDDNEENPEAQAQEGQTQEAQAQGAQEAQENPSMLAPSSFMPATDSRPESNDNEELTEAEAERARAIEDISQTCYRLLRKTRLQVRVVIECIHCRNPKHLIIDAVSFYLSPSLSLSLLSASTDRFRSTELDQSW